MKLQYVGDYEPKTTLKLPLFLNSVPAGFPSPADDYMDKRLDLNELIEHPAATYFCRASGDSMKDQGIHDGDLLIVDRAVAPQNGSIVVACVDGELTCKILDKTHQRLISANDRYAPIDIGENTDVCIEGVVIRSITTHHVRTG